MALEPLATALDLPSGVEGDLDRALDVASAAIRDAAGSAINLNTSTVIVAAGPGKMLGLPGPVRSVASVDLDGCTVTDFQVMPNGLWRRCGWGSEPVPVTVIYTYGLSIVPADIVDLTCQMAIGWLAHQAEGGGSTAGLRDARVDDAAESYTDERSSQISPVYIPEATRNWLANRFGGGSVQVVDFL